MPELIVNEFIRLILRSHPLKSSNRSTYSGSGSLSPATKFFLSFMSHSLLSWRVDEETIEHESSIYNRRRPVYESSRPRNVFRSAPASNSVHGMEAAATMEETRLNLKISLGFKASKHMRQLTYFKMGLRSNETLYYHLHFVCVVVERICSLKLGSKPIRISFLGDYHYLF